jgi:S-DNA-T family DNA segregation ATPase FtsK/SpoIIIE
MKTPFQTELREVWEDLNPRRGAAALLLALVLFTFAIFTSYWEVLLGHALWPASALLFLTFLAMAAWAFDLFRWKWLYLLGSEMAVMGLITLIHWWEARSTSSWLLAGHGRGGGIVGWTMYGAFHAVAGGPGVLLGGVILLILGLACWLPALPTWKAWVDAIRRNAPEEWEKFSKAAQDQEELVSGEGSLGTPISVRKSRRPRRMKLPPLNLLSGDHGGSMGAREANAMARVIEETLASFKVPAKVVSIRRGPAITQFGVEPGEIEVKRGGKVIRKRVRVNKIVALQNDLALALSASPIRIQAPVPGHSYVGIEVPNPRVALVSLKGVISSKAFKKLGSRLAIGLGRDVAGEPLVADLATLPHLLIAGATGSGKSVSINAILTCLLMNNTPDTLRLLLIDPKRVEFYAYDGIPHLMSPVVHDPEEAAKALHWMLLEMDRRYRLFAEAGVRNIDNYNLMSVERPLPYIVVAIDELADLMLTFPMDVEYAVTRLAQMSRATGIHLLVATQRPSVDVVTGLIKANFPARVAFAVSSSVDSRVILDGNGAERLLGRGDGLFMSPRESAPIRFQGCYVSDAEVQAVTGFWRTQVGGVSGEEQVPWEEMPSPGEEKNEDDELIRRAVEILRGKETTSTSWLQRRLRLGYPRAARLMEELEARGVVGPDEGAGRGRKVLIRDEDT